MERSRTGVYGEPLLLAIEVGEISVAMVDEAVLRVLTLKFRWGLFENPVCDPDETLKVFY